MISLQDRIELRKKSTQIQKCLIESQESKETNPDNLLQLESILSTMSEEARELYVLDECARLTVPPNPPIFYREFVANNTPGIYDNRQNKNKS